MGRRIPSITATSAPTNPLYFFPCPCSIALIPALRLALSVLRLYKISPFSSQPQMTRTRTCTQGMNTLRRFLGLRHVKNTTRSHLRAWQEAASLINRQRERDRPKLANASVFGLFAHAPTAAPQPPAAPRPTSGGSLRRVSGGYDRGPAAAPEAPRPSSGAFLLGNSGGNGRGGSSGRDRPKSEPSLSPADHRRTPPAPSNDDVYYL